MLYGSATYLPLTEYELMEWNAVLTLENAEREQAIAEAKNRRS